MLYQFSFSALFLGFGLNCGGIVVIFHQKLVGSIWEAGVVAMTV